MDILTFLGLRVALLMILFFIVPGINILKTDQTEN